MFDRYHDVRLDADPLVYAREQLRKAGIVSSSVCVALQDSIVYRSPTGHVFTAWTKAWPSGKVEVLSTDPGMPMWPSQPTEEVET